jgi:hypothetical protein
LENLVVKIKLNTELNHLFKFYRTLARSAIEADASPVASFLPFRRGNDRKDTHAALNVSMIPIHEKSAARGACRTLVVSTFHARMGFHFGPVAVPAQLACCKISQPGVKPGAQSAVSSALGGSSP